MSSSNNSAHRLASAYDFSALSSSEALKTLGVENALGLSAEERKKRFLRYGANELHGKEVRWFEIFLRQFRSPFTYLLLAAAVLTGFWGELSECLLIILFIGINTALGFYQEYKSEKTLALLKRYLVAKDTVLEGGEKKQIPVRELVPGDIIFFEPGDIIPADVRFLETNGLAADESALTGESLPVRKISEAMASAAKEPFEAANLGFSGTTVSGGSGSGIVVATGERTVFGAVAKLAAETSRTSVLEKEIAKFSSFILRLVIGTLILVVLINIFLNVFRGGSGGISGIGPLLIFAVALAVSVIPEALPVVITFSLSRGAARLAEDKAVVKRLSAIEDLGGIEILCTDKTGTLTENVLTASNVFAASPSSLPLSLGSRGEEAVRFYGAAGIQNFQEKKSADGDERETLKNSFEAALFRSLSPEEKEQIQRAPLLAEMPFDPLKRVAGVVLKITEGQKQKTCAVVRGASENVFSLCKNISREKKKEMLDWMRKEGFDGKRVFAVARKFLEENEEGLEEKEWLDATLERGGYELLGLVSFVDPLKATTREAVKKARELGVAVKILTGDSHFVAGSVGYAVGLAASPNEVLTGAQFDAAPEKEKEKLAQKYHIFARVSPEQKYRIIQTLQKTKNVGFLGDGINDAPALKIANVALVVSGASDIAREAADIVLLQKSLGTIIRSIEEGRRVFSNTTKYIRATLSSNFGNFYSVAVASFLIPYLPMLPLQILLLNILSDFPMIAVSTDNVDPDELRRPQSYNVRSIASFAVVLGIVSTIFDFIFFALFFKEAPGVLQTNWFIGSVVTELLFLFSIRTRKTFFRGARISFPIALFSSLGFLGAIVIPFTNIGATLFQFTPPTASALALIFFVAAVYFAATEIAKLLYYRANAPRAAKPF